MDISEGFQALLLDAYGVFWGGSGIGVLSGSKEAMENLVKNGKQVGILSNTTQSIAKEKAKLHTHGIIEGVHYHFLLTSGELAHQIFRDEALPFNTSKKRYWQFGAIHPKFSSPAHIFHETAYRETINLHEADFIYISIPHINGEDVENPELFRQEVQQLVKSGLPMVCANPDRFAHEGNPPKPVVRQGSIAALFEELGGQVFYIGKPYNFAFAKAMEYFQKEKKLIPSDVLMVGDTPETDIRGARNFGMNSALVIKTGIMAERISKSGLKKALAGLSSSDYPDFLIKGLSA